MTWVIRFEDIETTSDEFLIEDLESVEKSTGEPWSVANPLRSVKVAKAFLAVVLLRAGRSEDEVVAALAKVTLALLKHAFEYRPDSEGEVQEEVDPSGRPRPRTSRNSSRMGRGKGGSRATPEDRGLEISSSSSEKKRA